MKCIQYTRPYPLYHVSHYKVIRVCQDCGYLETCHGPNFESNWRHVFTHPDYPVFTLVYDYHH